MDTDSLPSEQQTEPLPASTTMPLEEPAPAPVAEDEAAQLLLGLVGGPPPVPVPPPVEQEVKMDVDDVASDAVVEQKEEVAQSMEGVQEEMVLVEPPVEVTMPAEAPLPKEEAAASEPPLSEPTQTVESVPTDEAPSAMEPSSALEPHQPSPVRQPSPPRSTTHLSPVPAHAVPFKSISPNSLAHLLHPEPIPIAVPTLPPPVRDEVAPLQIHMIPAKPISPPMEPPQPSVSFALPAEQPQPVASTSYIPSPAGSDPAPVPRPVKKRKRAQPTNPRRTSGSKATAIEPPAEDGIIRCVCMLTHDDGFTIQCDQCETWQHAVCMGIAQDAVPDIYRCDVCSERKVDQRRAMMLQTAWIANEQARRQAEGPQTTRGGKAATRGRRKDREGSRGRLDSIALDEDTGDASSRDRASPAASTSSAMPPPILPAKGKRRGPQAKPRAKPAKEHPTTIENFPSSNATSSSAASAAFKEPPTPASVQAQIQALSAGEDDVAWKIEAWKLEFTDVQDNVVRGRGVHQALKAFLDEWADDVQVEHPKSRRKSLSTVQDASGLPSPAEPVSAPLPQEIDLPPPDLSTLGPPIPPAYLTGSSMSDLAVSFTVKAIPESASFLPLGYSADPSAPHTVTAPAYMSSSVFARPTTYGVFADHVVPAGTFVGEYNGEILQAQQYRQDPINQYAGLGMPKPFVRALAPPVDLVVDARGYGSPLRFVRSGCHPNVVLRPILFRSSSSKAKATALRFGLFATRSLSKKEELILGWEWDDQHVVHFLDLLSRCPRLENGRSHLPALHPAKLQFILEKFETVLTYMLGTFTACACPIPLDCAVAQMAHLVETGGSLQGLDSVGKGGKPVDLGELVGATRGWRRMDEEVERIAREQMLLAQEYQRREDARRRELAVSEDEDDEDEDEEVVSVPEPVTVVREVKASVDIEMAESTPSPAKLEVKDSAASSSKVVVPTSPITSPALSPSPDPTPKAARAKTNGIKALALVPDDDDDDSGMASDTSTLTQPLSHRSSDSEEDSDRDDSDALSEPPASSPVKRRSPHRVVRSLVHSGDDTEEDEAPLRRHGKVVSKGKGSTSTPLKTPQGIKQSQSKLGSKTKPNGVKKIRQILSPPAPPSPVLPEHKHKPKSPIRKVEVAKSPVKSAMKSPQKSPVKLPSSVSLEDVTAGQATTPPAMEGGRTPIMQSTELPDEMPLPDVPSEALKTIFDEPATEVSEVASPGKETVAESAPEPAPEPVPEPVKQPTPPPVRRLTLADIIARRKATAPASGAEGDAMDVDEPAKTEDIPPVAPLNVLAEDNPGAAVLDSASPVRAPVTVSSPVKDSSPIKPDPSPVNTAVQLADESKVSDSPLELSPVRKTSESGGFDWSRHLPSSSSFASHLPDESRDATVPAEPSPWQPSPRYDGFRSLSTGSGSTPLTEATVQPSAESSWNPRPSPYQSEAKDPSPSMRPTSFPQTPSTAPVGLDLDLTGPRPTSPASPPYAPRSRPPPPLLQRDLPPHQQAGGPPPSRQTQESPVSQRTPLPPPGPRTSWPSSAPSKEPPRGPRGWHAGPPQSPVNGPSSLPYRAPTTPSPGYGQPSGRGGYGPPPRGPSSEYRGSRPWSRGRARGRGWMA